MRHPVFGALKVNDLKMQDLKITDQIASHENAGPKSDWRTNLQVAKMQNMKIHDLKLQDLKMTDQIDFEKYMTKFLHNLACNIL